MTRLQVDRCRVTFWALTGLHGACLLWWPVSVMASVYSVGALPEAMTGYLLLTSLAYPVFIASAVHMARTAIRKRRSCLHVGLTLAIPFLSGTWLTLPIGVQALLPDLPILTAL